jgi:hypothetical protein
MAVEPLGYVQHDTTELELTEAAKIVYQKNNLVRGVMLERKERPFRIGSGGDQIKHGSNEGGSRWDGTRASEAWFIMDTYKTRSSKLF